ncbi:asparaginyl-tRNA synthetase [Piedraia hortae CBS 480.64]|uniref:asparagine--tRNA ligase n=1 Tax=Piedraia hortae CBS 480.64 TaxID=1314780 RepID=A0A6A7BY97_9PEZI|nr:asparaginyl-tRNA synthetase [Piedraia hortae CBS 480.64]
MADVKVYIDSASGSDNASGSETSPYKTLQAAYGRHGKDAAYLVKNEDGEWKEAAKSALKKAANMVEIQKKKAANEHELQLRQQKEAEERNKVLEDAKKVVLTEDSSLPRAKRISLNEKRPEVVQLGSADKPGTRVKVYGRVHRLRKQKGHLFVTLRDGRGFLQCVLSGKLITTYAAMTLTRESSMMLVGTMQSVEEGHVAPDQRELHVDYYEVLGAAPGGDDAITNKVQAKGDVQTLLDQRHLVLRGETASGVLTMRGAIDKAFRDQYEEMDIKSVSPPALVQTMVEGGATLFGLNYYEQTSYLTQSSQLYLETCLPSIGDCYCIEKSFRAEKSLTRRHLSEYTHIEGELDFITFDDLLKHIETLICAVVDRVMAKPHLAAIIKELNPQFVKPTKPFKRMKYEDAIKYLQEKEIPNEEGEQHTFGDDIAEAAERRMTDDLNVPIFLTHFPAELKAFYMSRDPDDPRVTLSVDCLMPGVGEIVGGSMRMDDLDELLAAYKKVGIDPSAYYWYTDQRKYGTSPHGGYGLGLERFIAWLLGLYTVRDACLYPRFMGRCRP